MASMNVKDLKKELSKRNLSTSGSKVTLSNRLLNAMQNRDINNEEEASSNSIRETFMAILFTILN